MTKNKAQIHLAALSFYLLSAFAMPLRAESQGGDYKGITDPFGDPSNYEFSEDEKEDKEFFHLGRYLMLGVDTGVAIFTGGLGRSNSPGFYIGAKLLYFFDKCIAFEAAGHYARHDDVISPNTSSVLKLDTSMIPITLGFRYYFDIKNAPKAIAVANPYLAAGGGVYIRGQNIVANQNFGTFNASSTTTSSFGAYPGGGAEFNIYQKHIYLGLDFRYHFVFFPDEDTTYNNKVPVGDRAGDYFTGALSLTYNF